MSKQHQLNQKTLDRIELVLRNNPSETVVEGLRIFLKDWPTSVLRRVIQNYAIDSSFYELLEDELESR